jgi:hypothetical protein
MPTLRKIKRAAMQPHKPTQIASHFILPNRTQAHPPPDQWTLENLSATFDNKRLLKINFTNDKNEIEIEK